MLNRRLFNLVIPTQILAQSRDPNGYCRHPASPERDQSRISPPFCLRIPNPELQITEIPDPEKPVGDPQRPLHARLTIMYLHHHGSRSRQSYHGGSGNQPLWDLLLNESQNQRYDYCVHHYLRNNPMRKTQILCRISDRVTLGSSSDHEGKGSESVTRKLNSGGSKL